MILAQVTLEWSTIGIICGIVSSVLIGIVTVSNAFLKLFVLNELNKQSEHLQEKMEETFIRKETVDNRIKSLEERLDYLKHKAGEK